jgi:pimeloyl-ACP methyl ester carboxylesterase
MRIPPGLESYARTIELPRSRVTLFYYEAGPADAPPMVLLHGLGDEADTWRHVIGPLAGSHHVFAPDLPGFGRSSLPRRRLTPTFLADVLLEFLPAAGIRSAVLIGSSLGASIAQVMAIRDPTRISRLVLADGGIVPRTRLSAGLLLMLVPRIGERQYRSLEHHEAAAYETLRPYYADLDRLPASDQRFLRERVGDRVASHTQRRAYFSAFRGFVGWMLLRGRGAIRRIKRLPLETMYVWGSEDRIVPLADASIATRHPSATLRVIPGVGHLPHQESPEEFLRAVSGRA